jgi:hypothetical protein
MAQRKPEDNVTLDQVLKLVYQLTPDDQQDLCDELSKLQELRQALKVGVEQLERGEGVPGEQVFRELRARHADMVKKQNNP